MKYYLKRLGHQELGSVKNGKAQRGREMNYILDNLTAKQRRKNMQHIKKCWMRHYYL